VASPSDTVSGVFATFRQMANGPGHFISAIALTAGALTLSGCAGLTGSAEEQPQQPLPSTSVSAVSSSTAPPATNLPAPPSAATTESGTPNEAPGDLGDVAATRNGTVKKEKATLAVYPIRRSDTLAVMHFTLTLDPAAEGSMYVLDVLSDGDGTTGEGGSANAVDGVRLVDTVRRKVYLAASDGKGTCLCSRSPGGMLEPGRSSTFYVTYAAPPAEIGALDVSFPQFGTVSRVPVQ
jgi:hypothetical protein